METRSGSTLIEIMVGLMLLMIAVMGMQRAATSMFRRTSNAQVQLVAAQLAEDRIDLIKLAPVYDNLPSYAATENPIAGYPDYSRTTVVVQRRDSTSKGVRDFRQVTVRVTGAAMTQPVLRIHAVGAP